MPQEIEAQAYELLREKLPHWSYCKKVLLDGGCPREDIGCVGCEYDLRNKIFIKRERRKMVPK